jgi:integrase
MRLPPNINKIPELREKSIDDILALGLTAQSATTVRKKWSRLQAFFEWAVGQGYADQNYAKGKKPKGNLSEEWQRDGQYTNARNALDLALSQRPNPRRTR